MQKFGLQRISASQHSAIELEVVKEQASALGRSGKKLRLSLEKYQAFLEYDHSPEEQHKLIEEISNNVWELILQREFLGFTDNNLQWVRQNYLIPDEAINTLGKY